MKKTRFTSTKAPIPPGAISQAVILPHGIAYLSGQISQNAETGEIIYGTVAEQTEIILEHIKAIIEDMGAGMDDVVRTTCFVSSMETVFDEFNAVYQKYFTSDCPPTRCTVGAAVWGNLDVEISCEVLISK